MSLFVPPVARQLELPSGTASCSTPGCPFDGHPQHGGKCSACGQGWSPARLEQLRSLAEAADAETRARAFVDWDEPGVTLAPGRYEAAAGRGRWASNNTSSSVALEFVAVAPRVAPAPHAGAGAWHGAPCRRWC